MLDYCQALLNIPKKLDCYIISYYYYYITIFLDTLEQSMMIQQQYRQKNILESYSNTKAVKNQCYRRICGWSQVKL